MEADVHTELIIYLFVLFYFAVGAAAFGFISRRRTGAYKRNIWAKFFTYFIIIHVLFAGIWLGRPFFFVIALVISAAGYIELFRAARGAQGKRFLAGSLLLYTAIVLPFLLFSNMDSGYLYFVFITVTVFDAFSQICGQIAGGRKLIPSVSPNKTVSGLAGGSIMSLFTASLLRSQAGFSLPYALFVSLIIIIFALAGDLLASFLKRQYKIKDFGKSLPGHGGFLDRFDSLIPGGAAMYLLKLFLI